MGKDLNKGMFTGRLDADPELRYTDDGSAVATFRIASHRNYRDQATGQPREDTEWIRVVAWSGLAEWCHSQLRKNARVFIEGRIQTTRKESGPVQFVVELIAGEVIIISGAAKEQPEAQPPAVTPSPIPATPAEAERRFYARYGEQIGGEDWRTVQNYLGRAITPPATVDEWMTAAMAVREAGQRASRPATRPNLSPGAQAARRRA